MRDEPQPSGDGAAGKVSRRFVLPAQRGADAFAAPARASRRYSVAGAAFYTEFRRTIQEKGQAIFTAGAARAGRIQLARKRARAGERGAARRGAVRRSDRGHLATAGYDTRRVRSSAIQSILRRRSAPIQAQAGAAHAA